MQIRQVIVGSLSLLGLITAATIGVRSQFADRPQGLTHVVTGIGRWAFGAPGEHLAVSAVKLPLAPGDPIFLKMPDGSFLQVGLVRNHFGPVTTVLKDKRVVPAVVEHPTDKVTVLLYDDAVRRAFPDGFLLEHHTTPTALDWVVKTMLSPERQTEISRIIARDWSKHREKVLTQLQPILETSIARTVSAIETELPVVMHAHQPNFAKLADRYQSEIVRQQIVPLVRKEILPIVQEEVRPIATSLAQDLWDRVSLWSFTWRYLYDVSPLPEKNAVKLEFERFMQTEVKPALEVRSNDFVAATERILRRISRNDQVRAVVRENLKRIATDAELQTIVWSIVQDAVINNQGLRDSLRDYWTSAEVKNAMAVANNSFEPTARAIGDAIFGNRESGITPEFSRVLRAQILQKDRRWLVIVPKPAEPVLQPQPKVNELIMVAGHEPMKFPLQFEGTEQSPLSTVQGSVYSAPAPPIAPNTP